MIIQYACNRPASWPVNVNLVRQKQDLLSQSLECYIHRVVLITGFARDRKKEVVFSMSTLISYYPSVTKEDNRTKDDVKKFSRQRIINRSFSQESRRPNLCTKQWIGGHVCVPKKILWALNSDMLKLSFIPSNLQSCWPRDWKRSIAAFRESIKMQTCTRLMSLIFKNHNTPCFPSNILNLHCFLVPKNCTIEEIAQWSCKLLAVKRYFWIGAVWQIVSSHVVSSSCFANCLELKKVLTCEKSLTSTGFFCTQTWPPIHCFVHKYGRRDVMWKRTMEILTTPHIIGNTTFWLAHRLRVVNSWPLL